MIINAELNTTVNKLLLLWTTMALNSAEQILNVNVLISMDTIAHQPAHKN